jgi:hypothetical protein
MSQRVKTRGPLREATADVLLTKPPTRKSGTFCFHGICRQKESRRGDLRTAYLPSLRVCGQWLLSIAWDCKSPINNGFSVPCLAHYCRVLRPR